MKNYPIPANLAISPHQTHKKVTEFDIAHVIIQRTLRHLEESASLVLPDIEIEHLHRATDRI
jgi:hypothetical protein